MCSISLCSAYFSYAGNRTDFLSNYVTFYTCSFDETNQEDNTITAMHNHTPYKIRHFGFCAKGRYNKRTQLD